MTAVATVRARYDSRSVGIRRYVAALRSALAGEEVDYLEAGRRAACGEHIHFANSSRTTLARVALKAPVVLTIHDVLPRTHQLQGLQRRLVYPALRLRRDLTAVVHSTYAADLLLASGFPRGSRVEVIPYGARVSQLPREIVRIRGLPRFVLPGVLKSAKLVAEALAAAAPLIAAGRLELCLVGAVADRRAAEAAVAAGVDVVESPSDDAYDELIAAADAIVCLRGESVGETNGPLMDALGAGKAVLASDVGSIAEIAGDAAVLVEPTVESIRRGFVELLDAGQRAARAAAAERRGQLLSWDASARLHAELFREVFGG